MNQDDTTQDHSFNSQPETHTQPMPPADPPTSSALPPSPTPPPAPKASKPKTLIIALLALLVVLLVGAVVYLFAFAPEETNNNAEDTSSSMSEASDEVFSPAELIISDVAGVIAGEQQEISKIDSFGGYGADGRSVYSTASFRSGEHKFAVYPAIAYGLGTSSTAEVASSDIAAVTSHLTENNFVELGENSRIYASDDAVCAVQLLTTETYSRDGIGVGCANMNDYDASYDALLPFYEAYSLEATEQTDAILLEGPAVKDGIDGYKHASVRIASSLPDAAGGFTGLFFFSPETDAWSYFTGSQSDLPCSAYDTAALQKAFNGELCYEEDGEQKSSVTLKQ